MLKQLTTLVAAVACTSIASAGASYGFSSITNNDADDAAIGEAQFCVELIQGEKNTVQFYFTNTGPDPVSMVQLYWEDKGNVLSNLFSWSTTTPTKALPNYGVDFSGGSANPGHLPGVSPPSDFDDYSIQAKSQGGKSKNGVGTGEDVSVYFSYLGDYTALLEAMDNGDLQVGIHAQAYESGGSESFISGPKGKTPPPSAVPSPTAAFAGLGLMGLLVSRRRRRG